MVPKFLALRVQCKSPPPEVEVTSDEVFAQAIEVDGVRKLLVVNKQATARTLRAEGVAATAPMRFIAADDPWSPIRNSTWGKGETPRAELATAAILQGVAVAQMRTIRRL